MTIKCIIVDDEPVARKILEEYISDIDFLSLIGQAENPVKAQALLNQHEADLIFLDINMPKINGIEFLKKNLSLPPSILTTAYTEYAVAGYELDVIDYLVKPFSAERFFKAANRAKEFIGLKMKNNGPLRQIPHEYFFVKCDGKIEKVMYEDLLYVEAKLNYVVLHTNDKKMIVYHTIKGIAEQLPGDIFLRIHKSTIVNTTKIRNIQGNTLSLGSATLTISQNLQEQVMKQILSDRMIRR